MKKISSHISILIAMVLVFSALTVACGDMRADESSPTTETEQNQVESTGSVGNTDETQTTESESNSVSDDEPGNRVIYYEDFESYGLLSGINTVMSKLGWTIDSLENGAYTNNTANYRILNVNGNKMLYVKNNKSSAKDSYAVILSDEIMGKYHESSYTYQYDVIYEDAGDVKNFIAIVSEYDGMYYNSFHLRNVGYANNQCHTYSDTWLTYDNKGDTYYASYVNSQSVATRLLGVNYKASVSAFGNISVSIRYVVDWDKGNSIYIRINDEGYPGSGVWTLISKGNASSDYNPFAGGAAIALKVGGAQNGYIDNIIIWEGTGDEPLDKSSPLVTSHTTGCSGHHFEGSGICLEPEVCIYCGLCAQDDIEHNFVSIEGAKDAVCSVCHGYKSAIESDWEIKQTPVYDKGITSSSVYLDGHGIDSDLRIENDNRMLLISKTNEEEFNEYCAIIESCGYSPVYTFSQDGNIFAQYPSGDAYIYTYYTASVGEVRIIYDSHSDCSPEDFGYIRNKQEGETTVLYQYGVPMSSGGTNISSNEEGKLNCGMIYVIKLADNSVIIIDGGGYQQFDTAQIDGLMNFLRKVTGTKEGEKVKICAWYITHTHSDHMGGMCLFVKKYHENLDIERIFFNLPSVNLDDELMRNSLKNYSKLVGYISSYMNDAKFLKIHTGQSFNLAEVKVNVIYTHEDIVDAKNAKTKIADDFNNSSSVIQLEFDGKSFMVLGDINKPAMNIILANNSRDTLKSDIVQLAHHVINDVSGLYRAIRASVALIPQSPAGCRTSSTRLAAYNTAMLYVKNDMYFYASEETAGIAVVDGELVKVYTEKVHGGRYTGWGW